MKENLNKVVSKTAKQWKVRSKQDRANRRDITRAQAFALELMDYMDAHNIKQTELATKMGVSAQQVNKILRAKANLTFQSLDKIADALGASISSPKIMKENSAHTPVTQYAMQIVHKRKHKDIEENMTSTRVTKQNPFLHISMENLETYTYTSNQI